MNFKWIMSFVIIALLIAFTLQNNEIARVRFLFWSFETSKSVVIFVAIAFGIILGMLSTFAGKKKRNHDNME